jgi:SAM-dependent methyltransferase
MRMSLPMLEQAHRAIVAPRRARVLCRHLAPLLPRGARVLDIGCGSGLLSRLLMAERPDAHIVGVDVVPAAECRIAVERYDGHRLPFADKSFDAALLVDVLHHTFDPEPLLREAARVTRRAILCKDHLREGLLSGPTLAFMDWAGNFYTGVPMTYRYLDEKSWRALFDRVGLAIAGWSDRLGIYPFPASLVFDRRLHFVAALEVPG